MHWLVQFMLNACMMWMCTSLLRLHQPKVCFLYTMQIPTSRLYLTSTGIFSPSGNIIDAVCKQTIPVIFIDGGHMYEPDIKGWCLLIAATVNGNGENIIIATTLCNDEKNANVKPFMQLVIRIYRAKFDLLPNGTVVSHSQCMTQTISQFT